MIKLQQQSGFSLVETLVAISLLLIIIIGPMAISAKTAKSTSFASEQVQAFFLAQEGLELAQKARDDLKLRMFLPASDGNYIADPWSSFTKTTTDGLYDECFLATGCGLYWSASNYGKLDLPANCSNLTNCKLYINNNDVRPKFTHKSTSVLSLVTSNNTATPFTRKITFTKIGTDNREISVRSEVTWRTGSIIADQKVVLDTYLFNTNYENN